MYSSRNNFRLVFLILLLVISILLLLYFLASTSAQGGSGVVGYGADGSWFVRSYVWNKKMNAWGRSDCTLPLGDIGTSVVPAQSSQLSCTNSGTDDSLSYLRYYHGVGSSGTLKGGLHGRVWSRSYGLLSFDLSDFPSDDTSTSSVNEGSCYGLTGANRQPRIVRVSLGSNNKIDRSDVAVADTAPISGTAVSVIGCAYSSFLEDYVLLGPARPTTSGSGNRVSTTTPSTWTGVNVVPVENAESAYLSLFGCAWSSKGGFWSFGPNRSAPSSSGCLPTGAGKHNASLQRLLSESIIGSKTLDTPVLTLVNSKPKIGQRVGYSYRCPKGYSSAEIRLGVVNSVAARIIPSSLLSLSALGAGLYHELFTAPDRGDSIVVCRDHRSFFTLLRTSRGGASGFFTPTSSLASSFTVSPTIVTEGGFVLFGGSVSNQGSFSDRSDGVGGTIPGNLANCAIVNKTSGNTVRGFDANALNTVITGSDFVVQDTVYELRCRYREVLPGGATRWVDADRQEVVVKVLPDETIERHVSDLVSVPAVSLTSGGGVQVDIPPDALMVHVHQVNRPADGSRSPSSALQINPTSLNKIFLNRKTATKKTVEAESDISLRDKFFKTEDRSKVSVITGSKQGQTAHGSINSAKSSVLGKAVVVEARTPDGRWGHKSVYLSFNGGCGVGATENSRCTLGTPTSYSSTNPSNGERWKCAGSGAGSTTGWCVRCDKGYTKQSSQGQVTCVRVENGQCGSSTIAPVAVASRCSVGTVSGYAGILAGTVSTGERWKCAGLNGGATTDWCVACNTGYRPVVGGDTCVVDRSGVCGSVTAAPVSSSARCSSGVPISYDADTPSNGERWKCRGTGGGVSDYCVACDSGYTVSGQSCVSS